MKHIILSLLLFAFPFVIFAGNTSSIKLLGFSKDGAYAAFMRDGNIDGKGDDFAEVHIINIKKNSYAAKIISVETEPDSAQNPSELVLKKAKKELNKFKILQTIQGTDLQLSPEKTDFTYKNKKYQLVIKEPLTSKVCLETYQEKMLELILETGSKKILLQKDKKVPNSRECAISYKIAGGYVYKNSLLVFIALQNPGFEGPNDNHIAVTAKLD